MKTEYVLGYDDIQFVIVTMLIELGNMPRLNYYSEYQAERIFDLVKFIERYNPNQLVIWSRGCNERFISKMIK